MVRVPARSVICAVWTWSGGSPLQQRRQAGVPYSMLFFDYSLAQAIKEE
jgi:hypothetical protein